MSTPPKIDSHQSDKHSVSDIMPDSDYNIYAKFHAIIKKIDDKANIDLIKVIKYVGEMEQEIENQKQHLVQEG